jgi:hypothetical protein
MNIMLKNLALLFCLGFAINMSAQSTGSVNSSGLLQINDNLPWQTEYKVDLSQSPVPNNETAYQQYLSKYITALNTNATWRFDAVNRVVYLRVKQQDSLMPGALDGKKLNYFLQRAYSN